MDLPPRGGEGAGGEGDVPQKILGSKQIALHKSEWFQIWLNARGMSGKN